MSTDEKDQINSYHAQMEYYDSKINEADNWTHGGIFADEGISGTSIKKRVAFNKMITSCKKGRIDRILCKSISRFARNTVDCLETVRKLKTLGVAVYFEKENIDTMLQQSEFLITLFSSFAQAESESISANVRIGKRMSMAKGKAIIRTDMLLGYEKDGDGNIIIEPDGAKTIRRIYTSYLAGYSLGQIQNELLAENVPTASGISKWSKEVIQSILLNERYMGDVLMQKWYVPDLLSKRSRKNNGELPQYYVENHHEGIISKELWNRVQEEIARRKNKRKLSATGEHARGKYSSKYALTERLICGECGAHYRRVTWARNGEKRVVWRCISRLEHGTKHCKDSPTIHEYQIQSAIIQAINQIFEDKEAIIETAKQAIRAAFGDHNTEMTTLHQRKKDLKLILDELMSRNAPLEDMEVALQENFSQLEQVNTLIQEQQMRDAAAENEDARLKEVFDTLQNMPNCLTEYDDMLVRQIISSVTVLRQNTIKVKFECGAEVEVGLK